MKPQGIIFDLDGTLIDNNAYHIEAWKVFYAKMRLEFSIDEYKNKINGRISKAIFPYVLNKELSDDEINLYDDEKESLYRQLYAPHIKPVAGLINFLEQLHKEDYPMAVATSGLPPNIDFMFENIDIKKYFQAIINASTITTGKPHPEIFLKAAEALHVNPKKCIAFEDSVAGIRSAKAAGMKVVALTTTHTAEDVQEADLIINDYTEITPEQLVQLIQKERM
ncbi:MAG: HAD family phosphatase [Parafilimonas sp.]